MTAADLPSYFYNGAHATLAHKAYLMGGFSEGPTADVHVFDSIQNIWTKGTPLTLGRTSPCAVSYGGALYIIGQFPCPPNDYL